MKNAKGGFFFNSANAFAQLQRRPCEAAPAMETLALAGENPGRMTAVFAARRYVVFATKK
ncbi:MAG: hypothetical protein ABIT83_13205 [Massilia sp.]